MPQLQEDTRQTVLERDGHRCQFCGVTDEQHKDEKGRSLDIHHVIPRRAGGSDDPENLIPVCVECHRTLEATQGDALERIKEEQNSKPSEFDKVAQEKERLACENAQKKAEIKQLKRQIDSIYSAFTTLSESRVQLTIYAVHQTEFTTSTLLYVGTDEQKAYEKFSDADQHATMETANISLQDWVGALPDSTVETAKEQSESVGGWIEKLGGQHDD